MAKSDLHRMPHAAVLNSKAEALKLEKDILARLARRPMTVKQLASATLRGEKSVHYALHRLLEAGQVHQQMGEQRKDPAVWTLAAELPSAG